MRPRRGLLTKGLVRHHRVMPRCACCHREPTKGEAPFLKCSKCVAEKLLDGAVYCSKSCQKEDWPAHKKWHAGMAWVLQHVAKDSKPEDAFAALIKKGLRETANGNALSAVTTFEHAISLRPDQPSAHANLGHALRSSGQLSASVAPLLKAMSLYQEDSEEWATTAAVAWFSFAESRGADSGDGDVGKAAQLPTWLTHLDDRLAFAERFASAAPSSMQVWALLGMTHSECGTDLSRAAHAFMKAAKLTDQRHVQDGYRRMAKAILEQLAAAPSSPPQPQPTPKPMASHGTGERHWAVHPVHLVKVFVEVYSRSGTVFLKTCSQSTSTSSTAS